MQETRTGPTVAFLLIVAAVLAVFVAFKSTGLVALPWAVCSSSHSPSRC